MNCIKAEMHQKSFLERTSYIWVTNLYVYIQKKQQKQLQQLINSMEIGDSVETTSGFYGVIIDMTDDTVIVEFGSNKNCRIPMQKAAIVQVEKPEA